MKEITNKVLVIDLEKLLATTARRINNARTEDDIVTACMDLKDFMLVAYRCRED